MKAFLIAIFIAVSAAASCKTTGCKSGNCCSYWGYCGTGTAYCGSGKYQCACDCNGSNPCVSSCTNYKTTTSLNIRKGPSTSYSIVKTVAAGTTLCVVSTSNGWAKLSDGNYCSANYIKKDNNSTPQTPTSPSCTNYKTTTGLNIRKGPSTSYSIVKSVAAGTTLCVVSISSGWAKLSDGNYCSASYIQKDDGSTPQVPVSSGDKRKCPTFWNKYSKTAYPTRAQYAQGLRSIVGQYVNYTQGSSRWYGINNKVCPPSAPKWADCSSFTTWAFWTAFGGLSDIVNKQNWSAGYTGTMETCGKKISSSSTNCQPGDVILYPGHVATYVGNNQVVNYGSTGPVNVQRYNYHSNGVKGCYRYNLPFGSKF